MTKSTVKKGRPPKNWKARFFEALSSMGNVLAACRHAGVDRVTAYKYRHKDPEFAAKWETALEDAVDLMEAEALRRGMKGVDEPVYHQGKEVGTVKRHSDVLLMFLLKANRPEKYRDNYNAPAAPPPAPVPNITVNVNGKPVEGPTDYDPSAA